MTVLHRVGLWQVLSNIRSVGNLNFDSSFSFQPGKTGINILIFYERRVKTKTLHLFLKVTVSGQFKLHSFSNVKTMTFLWPFAGFLLFEENLFNIILQNWGLSLPIYHHFKIKVQKNTSQTLGSLVPKVWQTDLRTGALGEFQSPSSQARVPEPGVRQWCAYWENKSLLYQFVI